MENFTRAFTVSGNVITDSKPTKKAGNAGENIVTSLSFTFSSEWDDAIKSIVFKSPKNKLLTPQTITESIAPIPQDALDSGGTLQFSLMGAFADSEQVIRTPTYGLDVESTLSILGGTPLATYTNVVLDCQTATQDAITAKDEAVLATERIETTDADIKAAEAERVVDEEARKDAEEARAGFYEGFNGWLANIAVNVKKYGAIGDGLTDDTDAIKSAITTAGVGGTILFPAKNTYLLTSVLRPLAGQTLIGYGAIIKHANEVKTTTATAITTATNPTTFVVASAAGFRVGMEITITSGRTNNMGCYISHTITAINGNSITVSGNFTKAFPAGGTVVTNFGLIKTISGTDNIKILGLEFDGNRANNDTYLNWQSQACLVSGSSYAIFKDLYIHDAQADGIMFGGVGSVVDSCSIVRTGGNCLHLSGATGCKITNNYCKDATLSITGTDNATGPDHAEGVITFSSLIVDTIIANNHLENGRTCLGGIGSYDNSDITITGNTMRGATLYAIEFKSSEISAPYLKNIVITGNRFYNCAPVTISNNQSGGLNYESGNRNVIFNNNYLQNTTLLITRLKHGTIAGNVIDLTGNTTASGVYINDSKSLLISNNQLIGGRYGIYLGVTVLSGVELNSSDIIIDGNELRNQTDASLCVATSTGRVYRNVLVTNNIIVIEAGIALVGYVGIYAGNGVLASNNNLNIKGGSVGIACAGDTVATPYGYVGSMVEGNVVRTDTGKASIRIYGGMSNNIIHHNYIVQDISCGQPANNIVENNYTIL